MALQDIKPVPISSVLQQTWQADVPGYVVTAAIALPSVLLQWNYAWVYLVVGVAAGLAANFGMARWRQQRRIQDATTPPAVFPEPIKFDVESRAALWNKLFLGSPVKSFVMFSYGTCVVSIDEHTDPIDEAKKLLTAYGHAVAGTPSADMLVYVLPDTQDFVIGGHHPNILTFVPREIFPTEHPVKDFQAMAAFYWARLSRSGRLLVDGSLQISG